MGSDGGSVKQPLPTSAMGGSGGERCGACRWWALSYPGESDPSEYSDTPWGFCHRYPPGLCDAKRYFEPMSYEHTRTFADDFCGEFRPRPEARPS